MLRGFVLLLTLSLLAIVSSGVVLGLPDEIKLASPFKPVEEIQHVKHSTTANPFEKPILEYMEKAGLADDSKSQAKFLLSEQDSFDFGAHLSTLEILYRCKFEHQAFNVTSKDGYITQIVRIVNPSFAEQPLRGPPVVFYAGQGVSSAVFVGASMGSLAPARWSFDESPSNAVYGANRSLAILLANHGYDVWLVGARGTDSANRGKKEQSTKGAASLTLKGNTSLASGLFDTKLEGSNILHKHLQDSNYWAFSNDEIVQCEFRAQLDLILKESGKRRVSLVTYSNGAFIAYAFASLEPRYAKKHIDTMVNIGPAVFTNKWNIVLGTTGLLSSLSPPNSPLIDENLSSFARGLWFNFCKSKVVRYTVCKTALNLLYGFSATYQTHLELKMLDFVGRPMSLNGFRHILQCSYSNKLQRYDHGLVGNLIKYNHPFPPAYDLKRVVLNRVVLVSGDKDAIVDRNSVFKLCDESPTVPLEHIRVPGYNHLDLLAGWDVDRRINRPILKLLNERSDQLAFYDDAEEDEHHMEEDGGSESSKEARKEAKEETTTQLALFQPPTTPGPESKSVRNKEESREFSSFDATGQSRERPEPQEEEEFEGTQTFDEGQLGGEHFGGLELERGTDDDEFQAEMDGAIREAGLQDPELEIERHLNETVGWNEEEIGQSARKMGRIPKGVRQTQRQTSRHRQASHQRKQTNRVQSGHSRKVSTTAQGGQNQRLRFKENPQQSRRIGQKSDWKPMIGVSAERRS